MERCAAGSPPCGSARAARGDRHPRRCAAGRAVRVSVRRRSWREQSIASAGASLWDCNEPETRPGLPSRAMKPTALDSPGGAAHLGRPPLLAVRLLATLLLALLSGSCSKSDSSAAATTASAAPSAAPQKAFTAGFIYVGPKGDYGYNQAHAQGAAIVSAMPGIKVREEENVPETEAVQKTMESMIELDGASVIFPTSFGYFDPHILKVAAKYPKVTFLHCGGLYQEGKHPPNVGSYFGYIDEAQYVSGIVAGLTTKSGKPGFIAAKPIPQVLRNITSFP